MKGQFVELFRSSAVIQGTMALICTGAVVYLAVTGKPVPEVLVGIVMATVGFYFGTKQRTQERED